MSEKEGKKEKYFEDFKTILLDAVRNTVVVDFVVAVVVWLFHRLLCFWLVMLLLL